MNLRNLRNLLKKFFNRATKFLMPSGSNYQNMIGIDLGTANMVAYLKDEGILINEPSFLAFNKRTKEIVAIGRKAKKMVGRTPEHLSIIQPLIDGVISDFEASEELLRYILSYIDKLKPKILGPKVVVGIPSCATKVDAKSVKDAALSAGAHTVYVVPEPYAAVVGMDLNLKKEKSILLIDVGGGTSDLIVISGGEIIAKDSVLVAGDKLDISINKFLKDKKNIVAGRVTTETLKIAALSPGGKKNFVVSGRDYVTGLPAERNVSRDEIIKAIMPLMQDIVNSLVNTLSDISPEISADIMRSQIYLVGGGANISGFARYIERETNLTVKIPEDPMTIVAKGAQKILENPDQHKEVFLATEEE